MTARDRAPKRDQRQRDEALDREFRFHRDPADRFISVLAIVTRDADELAKEFVASLYGQGGLFEAAAPTEHHVEAALLAWERGRFGRELEPTAHGVLRLAVRRAPEPGR